MRSVGRLAVAGLVLAAALWVGRFPIAGLVADLHALRDETALATLAGLGIAVYGGALLALFGRDRIAALRRRAL
jgi:putative peptidoglycan lipid II flippase